MLLKWKIAISIVVLSMIIITGILGTIVNPYWLIFSVLLTCSLIVLIYGEKE